MEATVAAGPELLREATLLRFHDGDLEGIVEAWLAGEQQPGTDAFLARASASPVLEELPDAAPALRESEPNRRHCPACGYLPHHAVINVTSEALLNGQRR